MARMRQVWCEPHFSREETKGKTVPHRVSRKFFHEAEEEFSANQPTSNLDPIMRICIEADYTYSVCGQFSKQKLNGRFFV